MAELICLANSWRPGGRCVAGINVESGEWVRPVPPGGGAILEDQTIVQGRPLALLDVIELELDEPKLDTRFQCENREVLTWDWWRVRQATVNEAQQYCKDTEEILHNHGKVVGPGQIEARPPEEWTSLQLVHSGDVRFEEDKYKNNRWQARFSVGPGGWEYCLGVTDPEITRRLNEPETIGPNCLLTISLTEPIELPEYNKPELCYKLVAGVVEL